MKSTRKKVRSKRRGAVLILAMIFIVVFSALAVSMASLSTSNLQIANNQQKADGARACAESGIEVIRYWLSQVSIPGATAPSVRFSELTAALASELSANEVYNIYPTFDDQGAMTFSNVTLNSLEGRTFSASILPLDQDTLQVDVTGMCGEASRTVRVRYRFDQRAHTVFDFGVATKGPLSLAGNILLDGVSVSVDSSVYIESENSNLALSIIGNSQIAGDVSIVNSIATVNLQGGKAGIGGETGQDAIDNHVDFGVPPSEFPEPNPSYFEAYATNVIDETTDTSSDVTLDNIRIPGGLNPTFSGHATIRGIVFIETPNVVTFTGGVNITGIIVGDGDIEDDSGTNQINCLGNVSSHPVTELPDEPQFAALRDETGTFVMAPGFKLSFGGSFDALCGAMAGNGIEFFGNAGGIINGSILNYSDVEMVLTGNSDLFFNRSGLEEAPAGFVPELILFYEPESYSEPVSSFGQ